MFAIECRWPLIVLGVSCGGVTACGSEVSVGPGKANDDAAAAPSSDATTDDANARLDTGPRDGLTGDAAPVDAGKDGSLATTNSFLLSCTSYDNTGEFYFANAVASSGGRCALQHTGSCYVADCRPKVGDDAGALAGVSAGQIRIVMNDTRELFVGDPNPATGLYATQAIDAASLLGVADSIAFFGNGDVVPAFNATVSGFSGIAVFSPSAPLDGGAIAINRASDLSVTWAHHGAPVVLELVEPGAPNADLRALCEFEGYMDGGVIPAAILSTFATSTPLTLTVGSLQTSDITSGGYAIHLAAILATQNQVFPIVLK